MRRSSWIVLSLAVLFLMVATLLYTLSFADRAPLLDARSGAAMVEKGRRAAERGDTNALLSMFTDDALILGRKRSDFREVFEKSLAEIHGNFSINIRNVEVHPEGRTGEIAFIMDVGQKDATMDAIYFPHLQMRAKVERVRVRRWWGLFEAEEWKAAELTSDPPIIPRASEQ